jgi:hypothetical protein
MLRHFRPWLFSVAAVSALWVPVIAAAQTMQPGEVETKAALTGIYQFDTDLDNGGDFGWSGLFVSGSASRQMTREFELGVSASYDYQHWRFNSPGAFGGQGPWKNLNSFEVGIDFDYTTSSGLSLGISPTVGWFYESGAKTGDSAEWGAVITLAQIFSKDLVLGVGASVFNYMEDRGAYSASFFPIVKWQITDRLRLDNPFSAGIAGGAGLELAYAVDERWEVAIGASDRSYRFRLKDSGANANGIGENRFYPVFARVSYALAPNTKLVFYGAAVVDGKLTLMNPNGDDVAKDDYKTAPAIGLTLSHAF